MKEISKKGNLALSWSKLTEAFNEWSLSIWLRFSEAISQMTNVCLYGKRKVSETNGASHSMDVVGWAFIAVAVVLGVYTFLPAQVKTFVTNAFTKLNSGLGT